MAVADYNGDGVLDLATANYNPNSVSVLLGRGDGTFTTETLATGTFPYTGTTGDFNGDGRADLAHGDFTGHISIDLGRDDGTFLVPA
jgi:hypothetical protein